MSAAYARNGQPISAQTFYAIACDPRRSVAVEACAGAGKTWILVSRIVRALLEGVNSVNSMNRPHAEGTPREPVRPHEILAITFTRKAAGEMRERLDEWLKKFTNADDETLRQELIMRGVASPSPELRHQLAGLYRSMLAGGRTVQIRTFHSWFGALLRSAPVAVLQRMNLPTNYDLLEDDGPARTLVWRRFYAAIANDAQLKADFEILVHAHGRFQADKALHAALDKRTEFLLADAQGVVDRSVQPFEVAFPEFAGLNAPEDSLAAGSANEALLWRAAKALGQASAPSFSTKGVALEQALTAQIPAAMFDALLTEKGTPRKFSDKIIGIDSVREAQTLVLHVQAATAQHAAWQHQQRMARLSRVLIAEFTQLKKERGWVDMNDVERAALVMLGDPVLAGWVQERLDARIKHLMIDEFQDTNPLQWQALSSWLSAYAGAGAAPSVFLVGDPKQSIYRFRRAEPQVFRAAQAFVVEGLGGDVLSCDHTRRNAQAIMATVNATLGHARQVDGYDGFREHTTDSLAPGWVGCLPMIARIKKESKETKESNWRDSLTTPRELPEDTLRTLEARQAADWVAQQLGRGLSPKQVMVLSRKRAGLLSLQEALRALHIPAQIGEKTALIDCCEVLDLVALLDVLVSPQHDLSLARVLRSPLFGLSDASLIRLALLERELKQPWFALLQQVSTSEASTSEASENSENLDVHEAAQFHAIAATLTKWQGWLNTLPPHDALQAIYDDGDVLARFVACAPMAQQEAVLANLRALLGMALAQDGGRYVTPYGLVRALKAGGLQAPVAVNPHAVRLLTIHGAKGLEAEAVLLLDTYTAPRNAESMSVLVDWPGQAMAPQKFIFLISESTPPACAQETWQLEQAARQREELNALYVALTRARNTLVISAIEAHRPTSDSWWQRLQVQIKDINPQANQVNQAETKENLKSEDLKSVEESAENLEVFYLPELPAWRAPAPVSTTQPTKEIEEIEADAEANANAANADEPAEVNADADPATKARIGKAMHRLLEWGGATSAAHVGAVAREFRLSPAQAAHASVLAQRIVQGEGAWAWRADVVAWEGNEVNLVYKGQPLRLDRLIQRKDPGYEGQWWVLDYKSAPEPERQPALLAKMRTYRAAVQRIYPGSVVKAVFLTGQGTVVGLE